MLDADESGLLDFDEFKEVMKYFDLSFSEERLRQIFSKFDADGSAQMDLQEFEGALKYIKSLISKQSLDYMGFSKKQILKVLLGAIVMLLLIFAFIFVGIAAFSTGSTFGSVINSIMPISGGAIMGKAKEINLDKLLDSIKGIIQKVLNVLTTADV